METFRPLTDQSRVSQNRKLALDRARKIEQILYDLQSRSYLKEPKFLSKDRSIGRLSSKPKFEKDEIQQFITEAITHFREQTTTNEVYEKLNIQATLRELYDIFYLTLRKYNFSFDFEDLFGKSFQQWSRERVRDGGKNNIQQVLKLSLLIILLESYGREEESYQFTQILKKKICKIVGNLTDDVKWFYDILSRFDCRMSDFFYNIQTLEQIFGSVKQQNKNFYLEILDDRLVELIRANVLEP